jgi:ABC-type phosphate transport system substrate-binding protein
VTAALLAAVSASRVQAAPAHLPPAGAGYRVVVNAANPAASVTRSYVSRIFLKKVTRWTDGTLAAPVDLPAADPVREAFSIAIHGRLPSSVKAYWREMIFSGRASPPLEAAWEAEALAFVRANAGAIGYVSAAGLPFEGVKAVEVVD